MSKRIFGIFPKSGEAILKDALGQFKGIIAQINEGVKKVKGKLVKNDKKAAKIAAESVSLAKVMDEAINAATNLEAMLSGQLVMTEEQTDIAEEETVEADETEDTTSE